MKVLPQLPVMAQQMAAMIVTTWRNVLLNIVVDWNLSLLSRLLLLKSLLQLLSAMFAWTLRIALTHTNLLLTDALVWTFL
jgi:hypothetical protein